MKKSIISLQALLLILGVTSCHDSLLNMDPPSVLTTTNFFKSSADINQAVLGTYSALQSRKQTDYLLLEAPSDNLYMSTNTSIAGSRDLDFLTVNEDNTLVASFWEATYAGIYRANQVLLNIDKPTDYAANKKDQFTGEAKFMRALFYFDLVRMFGGVPKVTSQISIEESRGMKKSSADEIYDLIISDLKDAIDKLPLQTAIEKGRASKGAAVGLLGKVYVYRKDWPNAKTYLEKLMTEFPYRLEANFSTLWALATEDNNEVIFSVKYSDPSNGQTLSTAFALNSGIIGVVDRGNETSLPSWSLDKKYIAGDTRKDATISDWWVPPSKPNDPPSWYPYVKKYAVKHTGSASGLDLPVLRFADIVLLYAETMYYLQNPAEAVKQLNRVRERAFGNTSRNYTVADVPNENAFIDLLLLERQLEFAFENERWLDLTRTDRFMTVMTKEERLYNYQSQQPVSVTLEPKAYMKLFPIPKRQIDQYNKDVLEQNTGY